MTPVAPPVIRVTDENLPSIACDVRFSATASGEGSARWLKAKGLWFAGIDRSTPFDSATWSASEIQRSWDKTGIAAGQTQLATWTFYAGAPFTTSVEFHYQSVYGAEVGDEKTATVEFTCGPAPSADSPDPTVTALAAGPLSDALEPSDTLTVEYAATSPAGIWQTAVVLSGPCEVRQSFAERLQTSVTRSTRIPIPPECRLGVPLVVTVFAQDAGLRTGARVLQTHVALVDATPPTISALFFPPGGYGILNDLTGTFFGGDSIQVSAFPSDNHELRELVWEVLPEGTGIADSLALSGAGASPTIFFHLPLALSGPIQLSLHARDAMGLESNSITTTAGAIHVYPSIARPTKSAVVDGVTWDLIADARRGLVYLMQPNAHRIAVLSLSTMTVTGTILLPAYPDDFDISAGGDTLVIVLPAEHALGVVDLRETPWQTKLIPLTLLDSATNQHPEYVRTLSNGKAFVSVLGSVLSASVLIEVDLATGAQRVRTDAGDGGYVGGSGIARSLDHTVAVVNGGDSYFQRYDVASDHFGPRMSANNTSTLVVDATGRRIAVGFDIYDESLQHLRRVSSPLRVGDVVPTALSADGAVFYEMLYSTGLVRASVSDGALLDRTRNPIGAAQMSISDDGTLIVTATPTFEYPSKISAIDLR